MRLLHCIHSVNPVGGGPADFVRQCALLQNSHNFSIEVACLDAPDAPWIEKFPCKVHALGPGLLHYGYSPKLVPWLKQHAGEFDAIIVNGLWQFQSLATSLAAGDSPPYFIFSHGMLDPWFNEAYPLKRLKKQLYWLAIEYAVIRKARALFFTAEGERQRARKSFFPYHANEVVVPYGTVAPGGDLNQHKLNFFKRYPHLKEKLVLLFLGRICPKKGCDLLLKAFSKLIRDFPTLHLVMAGPCEVSYWDELKKLIVDPQSVTRLDMVTGDEKWQLLCAADAMVLPSHQENFARIATESLSCSTPVLLSDKVNIWSEVVESQAGLVAPDTLQGTEDLLRRFLALSADERLSMRNKAQLCFSERFDIAVNFKSYLQLVDTLSKTAGWK